MQTFISQTAADFSSEMVVHLFRTRQLTLRAIQEAFQAECQRLQFKILRVYKFSRPMGFTGPDQLLVWHQFTLATGKRESHFDTFFLFLKLLFVVLLYLSFVDYELVLFLCVMVALKAIAILTETPTLNFKLSLMPVLRFFFEIYFRIL